MATKRRHELPRGFVLRENYRIKRVLGTGGFAVTYLAHHSGLDYPVAIKEYLPDNLALRNEDSITVRPRLGEGQKFKWGLSRFTSEARMLARFKHPGIVPITDLFEANGTSYMVMEYVEGESLADLLERRETLNELELREIFEPILDALEEVHSHGILHRDIKPANIIVREDAGPVLLDFGCSRQTVGARRNSLTVALTPGYAPSEQYSSRGKQGPWTDIYAIGATLYRAVAGAPPPEAPDRMLGDDAVPVAIAARGNYGSAFLSAVDYALAIKPEDRPQDIRAFRRLLQDGHVEPQTLVPALQGDVKPAAITLTKSAAKSTSSWLQGGVAAMILAASIGAGYLNWADFRGAETAKPAVTELKRKAQIVADRKAREHAARQQEIGRWLKVVEGIRVRQEKEARVTTYVRRRKKAQDAKRRAQEARKSKGPPLCKDVGGYEAYMKRTNKVCRLH